MTRTKIKSKPGAPNITAKELAKQLVDEFDEVAAFRNTSSEIIFAIDPLLLHMVVAPKELHWLRLSSLLADDQENGDSFTVEMQGVSLARRVARHILLGGEQDGEHSLRGLLHGHAQEFVAITDSYHRAANDKPGEPEVSGAVATTQRLWFDQFVGLAPAADAEEVSRRIDEAITHVPDKFFKALGVSDADVRWQSCAEVMRSGVVAPLTREILRLPSLLIGHTTVSTEADTMDTDEFNAALRLRSGEPNAYVLRTVLSDAMALAHLQRVNVELGRQEPPRRCLLITSNSDIFDLLSTIPAVDFGAKVTRDARGDRNTAADYCLLDPYAFLDECHLRLTGSITHDATRDISGRLGKAFRIFGSEQIKGDDANNYNKGDDVGEFRQVWGAFLRASVLEQLQSERGIHSKRRREVLFALRNAGISTSSDKDKSFVRALTERGAKMMVEAADVAIATNNVEDFVRGAPFLRLDQHPHAEQMQWLEPREFRKQLLEPTAREELRTEAESLYTVHLMQARALVWEDRWSAATILTEFTLGLKDSLKAAGIQVGLVDGREAYLLASYCVRMHKVKADGLRRARGFIESFRVLAQGNPGLPAADRQLHALRADAEELAICTMELLEQNAPQSSNKIVNANYDSRPIGSHDVLFVDCERVENEALALVASMHSKAGFEKYDAVVLSAYLTAQQCWVNRTQAILLCGGQAGEIEALAAKLCRRYGEIDEGISQNCPMYKVGASRFTRTVALLAKVCSGASLNKLDSAWVSDMLKSGQIRGSAPYAEWRFEAISTLFKRYKISAP